MIMEFKTLDLRIRDQGARISVEAIGPNGEWVEAETKMPDGDLFAPLEKSPWTWQRDEIEQFSEQLGLALMPPPVLQLYTLVLERTLSQTNQGLRLKLHFLEAARKYQRYPWEAIKIDGQPLVMNPRLSLTRTADLAQPATPLAVERPPYRILQVVSDPVDLHSTQSEWEVQSMESVLQPLVAADLVELEAQHNVTLTQVEGLLRQEPGYHIFYFSGYTTLDADGNGFICFVDDQHKTKKIDAQRFASIFIGTGVRIAFLSTGVAVIGRGMGVGLADALLQVGLPIVVGHTYLVSNWSAQEFTQAFFDKLVETHSVDQAVFAGRRAMIESRNPALENEWVNPVLLTRTLEGRFLTGEAAYKVETFMREGRVETEVKASGEFDAADFVKKLQSTREDIKNIRSMSDQMKAKELIDDAELAINTSDWDLARQKLKEASGHIQLVISNQERVQTDQKRESQARWTVLGVSTFLLVVVALLAFAFRGIWTPDMSIPVISVPVSVLVWSFIGGVAAMLQAFVGTRGSESKPINYEWLLWRPVVGVIMGSVVYLAIAGGLIILGQGDATTLAQTQNTYVLWVLAFLGGFSDKFAILVFDKVVRAVSKSETKSAEEELPETSKDSAEDSTGSA
jgi:hypothetical protein